MSVKKDINDKIKILVTGANGQLGQTLQTEVVLYSNIEAIFLSKKQLDITSEISIQESVDTYQPDVIINTAAYTAVDKAEDDKEQAYLINATGVENLAKICKSNHIKLIHISTDYVFDGNKSTGYTEDDTTNPKSVYGLSKLAGEKAILNKNLSEYVIIRTSWIYSIYGSNFVKTMLQLAQTKQQISVVNDQVGSPTYANDLANAILKIINKLDKNSSGVYHYANEGRVSWFTFASKIFEYSTTNIIVTPVSSEHFKTQAKRPKNSVLEVFKIQEKFDLEICYWEKSLKKMLGSI